MLVDILRHVVSVYGEVGLVTRVDGRPVVNHPGVVLIDEVDSHLHPEWQRQIGSWLKQHFPKIQFIVTTHSAWICQAADPRGLFHLPAPGADDQPRQLSDEDYRTIIASKPNEIYLGPAFDMRQTRSPRAVQACKRLDQLYAKKKAKGRLTEAEAEEEGRLAFFANSDLS